MSLYINIRNKSTTLFNNTLFKNSSWGVVSQVSQTVFLSLFFVILARKFPTTIFAKYIIANAIYQLVAAFSTMGLTQWFIREFISTTNRDKLTGRFFKTQVYFGVAFYIVNIIVAYTVYDDHFTRLLIIVLGVNVVFDNLINVIKCLNVAEFQQKKTFVILTLESLLKFIAGCILFVYTLSIIKLSLILISIRFLTLNLFLNFGSSNSLNIKSFWKHEVSYVDIKKLVFLNWAFVIIGGVSIINWRIANIIISKTLTSYDVANYEISFKVFSIAQILPVVISTSVFPMLVKLYAKIDSNEFLVFFKKVHLYYLLFGWFSYTFIYTFSNILIVFVFGEKYLSNPDLTKQMFLTILLFPTALLQANVLITLKLEKMDMLFNIIALVINVTMCVIGLSYIRSLSVINYSIFGSFLIFHILQDVLLVRKNIISVKSVLRFYFFTFLFIFGFISLAKFFNTYVVFITIWLFIMLSLMPWKAITSIGLTKIFVKP